MNVNSKVFVPFTEAMSNQVLEALGQCSTDLVPFQLDYQCVHIEVADGETSATAASEAEA